MSIEEHFPGKSKRKRYFKDGSRMPTGFLQNNFSRAEHCVLSCVESMEAVTARCTRWKSQNEKRRDVYICYLAP